MAEVDELVIKISADFADLQGALRKTEKQTAKTAKRMSQSFDRVRDQVNKLGNNMLKMGTVAAAGAAAGFAVLVTKSIDAADKIGKLSTRIGASTNALSEYKHVAELSGVTFETLTMGWQRMTRRIAEAAQGTGEAKDALKELGLSASELAALRPEDQFERIADAMQNVGSQSDKVRLSMKLFDSEGVSLIQTMGAGAAGLREMRQEAVDLGISFDREATIAAANFNDAMTRMQAKTSGAAIAVGTKMLPVMQFYVDQIVAAGNNTDELSRTTDEWQSFTIKAIGVMKAGWNGLVLLYRLAMKGIAEVALGFAKFARAAESAIVKVQTIFKAGFNIIKRTGGAALEFISHKLDDIVYNARAAMAELTGEKIGKQMKKARVEAFLLDAAILKFNQTLKDPTPANAYADGMVNALQKVANEAGEKLSEATAAAMSGGVDPVTLEMERFEAYKAARIETMAQEVALQEEHDAKMAEMATSKEQKITATAVKQAQQIIEANKRASDMSKALWESGYKGRIELAGTFFGTMATMMESENRKAFEVGKAAAIAGAVVDTYKAATGAYAAMAGIPIVGPALGAAAAGAAIVSGMAQVNAIKSQTMGGGGGGAASSAGAGATGGAGTASAAGGGAGASAGAPAETRDITQFNIALSGGGATDEQIRGLISQINDNTDDNVILKATG